MEKETYIVISEEIGYPKDDPYFTTDDKESAEIVCKLVSEKYDCWCVVQDSSGFKWFAKGKFKR